MPEFTEEDRRKLSRIREEVVPEGELGNALTLGRGSVSGRRGIFVTGYDTVTQRGKGERGKAGEPWFQIIKVSMLHRKGIDPLKVLEAAMQRTALAPHLHEAEVEVGRVSRPKLTSVEPAGIASMGESGTYRILSKVEEHELSEMIGDVEHTHVRLAFPLPPAEETPIRLDEPTPPMVTAIEKFKKRPNGPLRKSRNARRLRR